MLTEAECEIQLAMEPILFFLSILNDKAAPKLQLHKSLLTCID